MTLVTMQAWSQSPGNPGFEYANSLTTDWKNTPDIGTYTAVGARSNVTARTGSWSYLSATTVSTSFCRQINVSTLSVPANNYVHLIAWAKGTNSDSRAALGGKLVGATGPDNNNNSSVLNTTDWTQLPVYNRQNITAGALNFQCALYFKSFTVGTATQVYFDDVIVYTDNVNIADLTIPTAATASTSPATTSNSVTINWTNGTDAGTGIQTTIILRTTNMNAATPALNNQGVYSTAGGASGPNTVSTNWTVISTSVGAGATSYTDNTVSASTAYQYAVVHRDLAYNYSSALVITAITNLGTQVNASDLPSCSTCDLAVAAGGTLDINAAKAYKSITVAPSAKLTLSSGTLTLTNGVTLESDANGTATLIDSYGVPTINATVKQYVESGRNWYVSSPVATGTSSMLSRGDSVVQYNEVLKKWEKVTGNLIAGRGYIQSAVAGEGSTGTVNFNGLTNSGTIVTPYTLTRTPGASAGFNLVGNPYPSYLDWGEVATANPKVLPTAYYRTKKSEQAGGGYTFASVNMAESPYPKIVSNDASTTITQFIPPMQAFWVRVAPEYSEVTDFTFSNANRRHFDAATPNNKFKAPIINYEPSLRLKLFVGNVGDETLIYSSANATNEFDRFDSPKMFNNSLIIPDLYTKAGNERLVINGLADVTNNMELPLGFSYAQAGELKLKATELKNVNSAIRVYLRDKQLSTETELTCETEYTFSTTTAVTNNESRFSLIFRASGNTTGIDNTTKTNAQVFVNSANQIRIIANEKCKYAVYSSMGQLIENGVTTSNFQTSNFKFAAGVYVVRVVGGGKELTTRVIIK